MFLKQTPETNGEWVEVSEEEVKDLLAADGYTYPEIVIENMKRLGYTVRLINIEPAAFKYQK